MNSTTTINLNGTIKVYDKRDAMNMRINKYTHSTSNIPRSINCNTFINQCIRFRKINSNFDNTVENILQLSLEFKERGFQRSMITKCILRFYEKDKIPLMQHGVFSRLHFIEKFKQTFIIIQQ